MKTVHLMGIGGTGMVALAGMFVEKGWKVRGSDKDVYPPASDELKRLKIDVRNGFRKENLEPRPDLVVVGNVISRNNEEAQALLSSGISYLSMPGAIAEYFLKGRRSLVITGTHGKSTTSSLTSWILECAGLKPGFFIGGFPVDFGWGYRVGKGDRFVLEGDEYDTAFFEKTPKFLHYQPSDVVITSIEFDHADIYRDLAHVEQQFDKLLEILPEDGRVVACGDHKIVRKLIDRHPDSSVIFYGLSEGNSLRAVDVKTTERGLAFRLMKDGKKVVQVESTLLGTYNVANVMAAMGLAEIQGVPFDVAAKAVESFRGLRRRQEFLGEARGVRIYDDFAHHPTAISETLSAFVPVANKCGGRLWAIFEPRSNTVRRRVFQETLPESFAAANEVILAPVFKKADSLSEVDMLDPKEVVDSIVRKGRKARSPESYDGIVKILDQELKSGDVVVFMSNGSFGGVPLKVKTLLDRPLPRRPAPA